MRVTARAFGDFSETERDLRGKISIAWVDPACYEVRFAIGSKEKREEVTLFSECCARPYFEKKYGAEERIIAGWKEVERLLSHEEVNLLKRIVDDFCPPSLGHPGLVTSAPFRYEKFWRG